MPSLIRLTDEDYAQWLKNSPETSLWQSLGWKRYKEALGRETRLYGLKRTISNQKAESSTKESPFAASALVIIDKTVFGLSTWDIPRGPLGNDPEAIQELLEGIVEEASRERALALYFSPACQVSGCRCQVSGVRCQVSGFRCQVSGRSEQPEATVLIDLTQDDNELMAKMREKGRYNIRLAQRRGITVEASEDIDAFYTLLQATGKRDRYTIKPKDHYRKFLTSLSGSFLLLAYDHSYMPKKAIAGLLGVIHGGTGVYYYGASDHAERAKMAPSLLQFESMRYCRDRGATTYDLFGINPPEQVNGSGAAMNHSHASARSGSWAGVTRFKKQFGGKIVTYPQEREIVLRPLLKKLLALKRKFWT